jgi:hypothetical protein
MIARMSKVLPVFISAFLLTTCGDKKASNPGESLSGTEQIFMATAAKYRVPYRLLLAVAFKESGIFAKKENAVYLANGNLIGTSLSETAFGLSREKLGIAGKKDQDKLQVQADAYGKWVSDQLQKARLDLPENPANNEEFYNWIWSLASFHRSGYDGQRNIQVIFARELIDKLNEGDFWQDPATGDRVTLTKQANPIVIEDLPIEMRENLQLFSHPSDIEIVNYFELAYRPVGNENKPDHIIVIHCPLSLSACLQLQHPAESEDEARLSAHYIIPPDTSLVTKPLQVASHKSSVLLTNQEGKAEEIKDAIVIMLAGQSGRYVEGKRVLANPKWFTREQLIKMAIIIREVCSLLKRYDDTIDVEKCITPASPQGVIFQHQGASDSYQWGDIPDYDENIFWSYIFNPEPLSGKVVFDVNREPRVFSANETINFNLDFFQGTSQIILERLERCPDGKLIWSTVEKDLVRNQRTMSYNLNLYYGGPNNNGQHFLRALVYDYFGKLSGWAIEDLFVKDYDAEIREPADLKECNRNGT